MSEATTDPITLFIQEKLQDAKPIIIGLGREGLSTYHFLRSYLPKLPLLLADEKKLTELDEEWLKIVDQDDQVSFVQLKPEDDLQQIGQQLPTIIFKTPGLPTEQPVIKKLIAAQAELSSNTMLCFEIIDQLEQPPITIGVTGTKGKSTTASLIHHVLESNQLSSNLAGNIGTPPLSVLKTMFGDGVKQPKRMFQQIVVFELSSHQLRENKFSPHMAVVQNVTPEHLDYYDNFEIYQKAKSSITAYQKENDIVIFNPGLVGAVQLADQSVGKKLTFAINPEKPDQLTAYADESTIFYDQEAVIDRQAVPLIGEHNLQNVLPAVIIGRQLELTNEQIAQAIQSFKPLAHRLEFVAEKNGVQFVNDSQATTPEAARAALASFPHKNIHLIAGGSDKGVDLQPFVDAILTSQVKTIILFPPIGEKIAQLLSESAQNQVGTLPNVIHVSSMTEAVNAANQNAEDGDVVLLSPACASFGIFKNYQDRGDQFKANVRSSYE